MRERIRNGAAIVIAGLCLALAIPGLFVPDVAFTGVTLRFDGSVLVVDSVDPASTAYRSIQPGMIVYDVNYALVEDIREKDLDQFLRGDFLELGVVESGNEVLQLTFAPLTAPPAAFVFLVGVGLLFGIAIWVGRGQAGETLRPLALPLATATAASLILLPTGALLSMPINGAAVVLATGGLLVLADGFVEAIPHRTRRRATAVATAAVAMGYVVVALGFWARSASDLPDDGMAFLPWLALALAPAITLVPAVILLTSGRRAAAPATGRSIDRLPILLAALTPIVIATSYTFAYSGLGLSVPLIWLLIVVVVLQAHARIETHRLQRDRVVAATEVERARLAADLHDDALQEMTVLVRRLDDAGDKPAADLARSIADRLREVCGELRLPILDELGAGAALEWLVERVGETSGSQVRLERDDGARPPADVELAVFRVAQEALANAVTHGAPPIVVRYAAASDRASLSISDRGAGIASDAAAKAARSGHYGLLNMRQRAEQIGAGIDVRRPPDGGTTIRLSWSSA